MDRLFLVNPAQVLILDGGNAAATGLVGAAGIWSWGVESG